MTDLRVAAQQALEALELIDKEFKKHGRQHWPEAVKARNTAPALRAALAGHECPNCASLEEQNTELDRKLDELTEAVLRANGIGGK